MVKNGRKVIGYEMQITDNRQPTTAEVIQQAEKDSYQTDIYDFWEMKINKKGEDVSI